MAAATAGSVSVAATSGQADGRARAAAEVEFKEDVQELQRS